MSFLQTLASGQSRDFFTYCLASFFPSEKVVCLSILAPDDDTMNFVFEATTTKKNREVSLSMCIWLWSPFVTEQWDVLGPNGKKFFIAQSSLTPRHCHPGQLGAEGWYYQGSRKKIGGYYCYCSCLDYSECKDVLLQRILAIFLAHLNRFTVQFLSFYDVYQMLHFYQEVFFPKFLLLQNRSKILVLQYCLENEDSSSWDF